jgi:hypothetical protein
MNPPFSRRTLRRALGAVLVVTLAACGAATSPENRPPDFSGVVVGVQPPSGPSELVSIARAPGDTAVVRIGSETKLLLAASVGRLESVRPEFLTRSRSVDVWTSGIEYRSLPPQYEGTQLVVH